MIVSIMGGFKKIVLIIILDCAITQNASATRKAGEDTFRAAVGKSRQEFASSGGYLKRMNFEKSNSLKRMPMGMEKQMAQQVQAPSSSFNEGLNSTSTESIFFSLHTLLNPTMGHILSEDALDSFYLSSWALNYPVKLLVHDYRGDCAKDDFSTKLREGYLTTNKLYNIVCMDWRTVAGRDDYFEVASSTSGVGKRLADFLAFLKRSGYIRMYDSVHVIGYGLGAHIAGIAGKLLQQRNENDMIDRVTGLDPSGPGFESASLDLRLDKGDAKYVDVIHTNMGSFLNGYLGLPEVCGHADFFPNGGTFQPTCGSSVVGEFISVGIYIDVKIHTATCSHQEAYELFQRSIRGAKYHACPCQDWTSFQRGDCGDCRKGPLMGENLNSEKTQGLLYFRTSH